MKSWDEPCNVEVVVKGKNDDWYLINECGLIKCVKSIVVDHVHENHVSDTRVTEGDEHSRRALHEANERYTSLSNELAKAKKQLYEYKNPVEDQRPTWIQNN